VASDEDAAPRPSAFRTMMLRGAIGHCPICGSGHLFERLKMRERCPRCGHRFDRKAEDGFFLGAYLINLAIGLVLIAIVLMAYGLSLDGSLPISTTALLVTAGVLTLFVPFVFYRISKTLWAAIELTLHPAEPEELTSALTWLADRESARQR
jgi:uncharacterized protein (DUF983 family)